MVRVNAVSVDAWTGASGLWSLGANWSLGRAPKSADLVDIEPASPLTVTFDVAGASAYVIGGLTVVGAELDVNGGVIWTRGAVALTGATISGTKYLTLAGASEITGLTVSGTASLNVVGQAVQSGADVTIGGAAALDIQANASWTIADASGMTQTSAAAWAVMNRGLFAKTSQTGVAWIRANFWSNGTIASAVNGDIVFDGRSNYLTGTYIGPGMVDYGPDGITRLGAVQVTQASCQSNFGTVNLIGDMTMNDGSTIMNAAGARWNFAGDVSLLLAAGQAAGPDINGMGMIAKTGGTGTSHIGVDAEVEGAVWVATGALAFEGASSAFSSSVVGAGTFVLGGGASEIEAGARLSVAHWELAGGTTTLAENLTYAGAFAGEAGSTLDLGGETLTLSGTAQLSGLAVSGAGTLRITGPGADTVSGLTLGGSARLTLLAAISQSGGDVTLGDADAATLVMGAGGVWDVTDSHAIQLGADAASYILIASGGLLEHDGAGQGAIAPTIYNDSSTGPYGGLAALTGSLDVEGAVRGVGVASVAGGATLEFDNLVAAGQTVAFTGAGTLALTDLADFHGKITGFDATDTLLASGGWAFASAKETAAAATLAFVHGGAHQTLTLAGDYRGGMFSAGASGQGEIAVTYAAQA